MEALFDCDIGICSILYYLENSNEFLTRMYFFVTFADTSISPFLSIFGKSFSTNSRLKLSGKVSITPGLSTKYSTKSNANPMFVLPFLYWSFFHFFNPFYVSLFVPFPSVLQVLFSITCSIF